MSFSTTGDLSMFSISVEAGKFAGVTSGSSMQAQSGGPSLDHDAFSGVSVVLGRMHVGALEGEFQRIESLRASGSVLVQIGHGRSRIVGHVSVASEHEAGRLHEIHERIQGHVNLLALMIDPGKSFEFEMTIITSPKEQAA